jgi:hypothetical protein
MHPVRNMLTTLTTSDLASVIGGCGKGQQQQQIIQPPPQVINNYIPAPQQQQQQAIVQAPPPAAPQMPLALPRPRKSVDIAVDQTTALA